ncbi:conserved hypothetical protein [Cupriavidus taiwanensis]|uniref:Uncharacterized protein n=1 Tax=Cupriavidus taiwanensis TaxID=164546 RepID=A0A375C736_9BURK|nr:type II toxin-antitoxin system HipA family toxin [Cupriavidus taiwanensis]SOY63943.1 conserved hypothetical protein [Cupriavidus taiwanensis]
MTPEDQRGAAEIDGVTTLVAEAYDRETDSIESVHRFHARDITGLCRALEIETFESGASYELNRTDIETLNNDYGVSIHHAGRVMLRMRSKVDEYPYLLHTNRELLLMHQGRKPLSVFAEDAPSTGSTSTLSSEAKFDAQAGRFVKYEYAESVDGGLHRVRRIFYALPDEVWRIRAYILLLKTSKRSGWNEGFERMEGSLLGYSEQENDINIELRRKLSHRSA